MYPYVIKGKIGVDFYTKNAFWGKIYIFLRCRLKIQIHSTEIQVNWTEIQMN